MGSGRKSWFDWRLGRLYGLIHELQPACLIINNHHLVPFEGRGCAGVRARPAERKHSPDSQGRPSSRLPLENLPDDERHWGYKIVGPCLQTCRRVGSTYLAGAAGRGADLLLSIGPQPTARSAKQPPKRLAAMGAWLDRNGATIYGTEAGLPRRDWGVTTQRGDKVWVHILDWPDRELFLPLDGLRVTRAVRYADGRRVAFQQDAAGVTLRLGGGSRGPRLHRRTDGAPLRTCLSIAGVGIFVFSNRFTRSCVRCGKMDRCGGPRRSGGLRTPCRPAHSLVRSPDFPCGGRNRVAAIGRTGNCGCGSLFAIPVCGGVCSAAFPGSGGRLLAWLFGSSLHAA